MGVDAQNNPVSTDNQDAIAAYDEALRRLNRLTGNPIKAIDPALQDCPDFIMGHLFKAAALMGVWEPRFAPGLLRTLEELGPLLESAEDRERAHAAAIRAFCTGAWERMRRIYSDLLAGYPGDLLALQIVHNADFYCGDAVMLRDRPMAALKEVPADLPGRSYMQGMLAFGLEECGDYGAAEEAGRAAIAADPGDCWAQHAVAHVMEMQGRADEGAQWQESRAAYWGSEDNSFARHNSWHWALFLADETRFEDALGVYDTRVWPSPSKLQIDLLDAASFLWRLTLMGEEVGDRWQPVAALYAKLSDFGTYAFNDLHAAFAFIAVGEPERLSDIRVQMEAAATGEGSNAMMSRMVGLPALDGLIHFARGDYASAADSLLALKGVAHLAGGSHAQRDILERTALEAAIRARNVSQARQILDMREGLKPGCAYVKSQRSRLAA